MKRIAYIGLAFVLVGLIAYGLKPRPVSVDLGAVTIGPMRVTVDEEGKTRIKERYVVVSPLSGQMRRIELKPGDPVVAGQTLLTVIEPTDPALLDARAVASAKARVNSARAAKDQSAQLYDKSKVGLDYAQVELKRAKATGRAASDQAVDEAETLVRSRQADLKAAAFAQLITNFELEQAEAALLQVSPGSASAAGEPPRLVVPSPITGVVLSVKRESAGVIAAGAELVELGDPKDLEVVVEALSKDAVMIKPGAPAFFEQWGGEKPLNGRVRRIEPAGFTKISALGVEEQRVNVLLDFTDPFEVRSRLGHGFRVEARIVVWQKEGVLRVPVGALFHHDGGRAVYRVENGVAKLRPVEVGRTNALEAEVLGGLAEGDSVVMHPRDTVSDGTRVVARK